MSTSYRTVMAAIDFSPLSLKALEAARVQAVRLGARRLHLEHVVTAASGFSLPFALPEVQVAQVFEKGVMQAQQRLERLEVEAPGLEVTRQARLGLPPRELAEAARELDIDLVVMASHGYGPVRRAILGSVASNLIRTAPCPVLVVGENRPGDRPIRSVLAAVDLSLVSQSVLEQAVAILGGEGSLNVLSLYEHPLVMQDTGDILPHFADREDVGRLGEEHRRQVQALVERIPHEGVRVHVEVMSKAPPALVILESAAVLQPDLVVVGASGHGAFHRMIVGSTATRVLAEAQCPVLVVPPPPEL